MVPVVVVVVAVEVVEVVCILESHFRQLMTLKGKKKLVSAR